MCAQTVLHVPSRDVTRFHLKSDQLTLVTTWAPSTYRWGCSPYMYGYNLQPQFPIFKAIYMSCNSTYNCFFGPTLYLVLNTRFDTTQLEIMWWSQETIAKIQEHQPVSISWFRALGVVVFLTGIHDDLRSLKAHVGIHIKIPRTIVTWT